MRCGTERCQNRITISLFDATTLANPRAKLVLWVGRYQTRVPPFSSDPTIYGQICRGKAMGTDYVRGQHCLPGCQVSHDKRLPPIAM